MWSCLAVTLISARLALADMPCQRLVSLHIILSISLASRFQSHLSPLPLTTAVCYHPARMLEKFRIGSAGFFPFSRPGGMFCSISRLHSHLHAMHNSLLPETEPSSTWWCMSLPILCFGNGVAHFYRTRQRRADCCASSCPSPRILSSISTMRILTFRTRKHTCR